jgi:hypothetical protein
MTRCDPQTPDLVRLPGAKLVRASEPANGMRLHEAEVQALTGGEAHIIRNVWKSDDPARRVRVPSGWDFGAQSSSTSGDLRNPGEYFEPSIQPPWSPEEKASSASFAAATGFSITSKWAPDLETNRNAKPSGAMLPTAFSAWKQSIMSSRFIMGASSFSQLCKNSCIRSFENLGRIAMVVISFCRSLFRGKRQP